MRKIKNVIYGILAGLFPVEEDFQRITKCKQYERIFNKERLFN